ncbi:MAG: hypothetical protein LBC99_06485 [Spirochaetota bacterium]|jgi:hypothetical protein|nr:hypothetical protein [Spirochaetota bacterium]
MPKEHKPGFRYKWNEALGQEIAISEKTGAVYCEDGVYYSPEEVALLKETGSRITKNVHLVKKAIDGTIISVSVK